MKKHFCSLSLFVSLSLSYVHSAFLLHFSMTQMKNHISYSKLEWLRLHKMYKRAISFFSRVAFLVGLICHVFVSHAKDTQPTIAFLWHDDVERETLKAMRFDICYFLYVWWIRLSYAHVTTFNYCSLALLREWCRSLWLRSRLQFSFIQFFYSFSSFFCLALSSI